MEMEDWSSEHPKLSIAEMALPSGVGQTGFGETFQASSSTGALSFSIPIPVTPCNRRSQPALQLYYGAGSGVFGKNFALDLPSVSRRTDKGIPQYRENDHFVLAGDEQLVVQQELIEGAWHPCRRQIETEHATFEITRYRPRIESSASRIEFWVNIQDKADSHWRITNGSGVCSHLGSSAGSKIVDPADPTRIFEWLIDRQFAPDGSCTCYQYREDPITGSASRHPDRISYGNLRPDKTDVPEDFAFEVIFDYGERDLDASEVDLTAIRETPQRPDPVVNYRAGFERATGLLCHNILMVHRFPEELGNAACLVSATSFEYETQSCGAILTSVRRTGFTQEREHTRRKSLPPLDITYSEFTPQARQFAEFSLDDAGVATQIGDGCKLMDLFGDGLPGVLLSTGDALMYARPNGDGCFEAAQALPSVPLDYLHTENHCAMMDITGMGRLDMVLATPSRGGFYRNNKDGSWQEFRPFEAYAQEFAADQAQLVDLSGDGLADICVQTEDEIRAYSSRGEAGFSPPVSAKLPDSFATGASEPTTLVSFADMFGDGLAHKVRISDGRVAVWPNLGHGNFGAMRLIDNAPAFRGDLKTSRILLADVSGSGTADLLFVHNSHVDIHLNLGGTAFAEALTLTLPRAINDLDQVQVADILGSGTASLVVSQADVRAHHFYIDLCGGERPFAIKSLCNNRGLRTEVNYRSSVHYYLKDAAIGRPWQTRLSFPVQVVSRVMTIDEIGGTRQTRSFQYRDGYNDPVEREFCGFAFVQIQDTETKEEGLWHFPDVASGIDSAERSEVEPSFTRTWQSTGFQPDPSETPALTGEDIYDGDPDALVLCPSVFSEDILQADLQTRQEACRALKGIEQRQEVFALEGGAERSEHPLQTTQSSFEVTMLQPRIDEHHAVFQVRPRETATSIYEGQGDDPRVSHRFSLEFDSFGNEVVAAQVAYPRRVARDRKVLKRQRTLITTATSAAFINVDEGDVFLSGVPFESCAFEICNLAPKRGETQLRFEDVASAVAKATAEPETFGSQIATSALHGRVLSRWQGYYTTPAGDAHLPFGSCSSEALLHHSRTAVFPDGFAERTTDGRVDAATLGDGGYVYDAGYWWQQSPAARYLGKDGFCLTTSIQIAPHQGTDYFTSYSYDPYALTLTEVTDPAGQSTTAETDYRTMQPRRLQDTNGLVSEAVFDALGQTIATSIHRNSGTMAQGNMCLEDYAPRPDPEIAAILDAPEKFLQGASSFTFHDTDCWTTGSGQPLRTLELRRRDYLHQPARVLRLPGNDIQITLSYVDGFDRALCTKQRVEAGAFDVSAPENAFVWMTSGKVDYNSKGEAAEIYRPFVSKDPTYTAAPHTPSDRLTYDAIGRVTRTDTAKGFSELVSYRPWETTSYDANDTVTSSTYFKAASSDPDFDKAEMDALEKARQHADTPTTVHVDPVGRTIQSVARLRDDGQTIRSLVSASWYDGAGNRVAEADPRFSGPDCSTPPETANLHVVFTMTGEAVRVVNVDAGTHIALADATGAEWMSWTARDIKTEVEYDCPLRRPIAIHCTVDGVTEVRQRFIYGENANDNNRGRLIRHFDQAGVSEVKEFDILGSPVSTSRRLSVNYRDPPDWTTPDAVDLEPETWTHRTEHDAQGQMIRETCADGSFILPESFLNGWLRRLHVKLPGKSTSRGLISSVTYGSEGERRSISYANGIETKYGYEPTTLNLTSLVTTRPGTKETLQDIAYTYDPVGNITRLTDRSAENVFHSNQQIEAVSDYTYDARYRLVSATGRQHPGLVNGKHGSATPADRTVEIGAKPPGADDIAALENYIERFAYDDANNLTETRHQATSASWTRRLSVAANSNRAVIEGAPADRFDANGNLGTLDNLAGITWNERDNIARLDVIDRDGQQSDSEYYVYDADGTRLRKVTERMGSRGQVTHITEKIYLGGLEITRVRKRSEAGETLSLERHSLHVADGLRRIATLHSWTKDARARETDDIAAVRCHFQHGNHLGSAALETDADARVITYDEYLPYGGTALSAARTQRDVRLKEYRYAGKKQDATSGLYYYGARYYSPWLGRWLNPDPAGPVDGLNLYAFVGGNPIGNSDLGGNAGTNVRIFCAGTRSTPDKIVPETLYTELTSDDGGWACTTDGAMKVYTKGNEKVIATTGPGTSGLVLTRPIRALFGNGSDGMATMEQKISEELKKSGPISSITAQGWSRGAIIANNSVARFQKENSGSTSIPTTLRLWDPVSGGLSSRNLEDVDGTVHRAYAIRENTLGFMHKMSGSKGSVSYYKGVHGDGATGDNIERIGGSGTQLIEDGLSKDGKMEAAVGDIVSVSTQDIMALLPSNPTPTQYGPQASLHSNFGQHHYKPAPLGTFPRTPKFAGQLRPKDSKPPPKVPANPKPSGLDYSTADGANDATIGNSGWY